MSDVQLTLAGEGQHYAPDEKVSGTVSWQLDRNAKAIELRLFWYTLGKGTQDMAIVDRRRIDSPAMVGDEPFTFTLPDSPYSFSGLLITLRWGIEAVILPGKEAALEEFTVSATGHEVVLKAMR